MQPQRCHVQPIRRKTSPRMEQVPDAESLANRMEETMQSLEGKIDLLSDQLKVRFRELVISQINLLKYRKSDPKNFDIKLNKVKEKMLLEKLPNVPSTYRDTMLNNRPNLNTTCSTQRSDVNSMLTQYCSDLEDFVGNESSHDYKAVSKQKSPRNDDKYERKNNNVEKTYREVKNDRKVKDYIEPLENTDLTADTHSPEINRDVRVYGDPIYQTSSPSKCPHESSRSVRLDNPVVQRYVRYDESRNTREYGEPGFANRDFDNSKTTNLMRNNNKIFQPVKKGSGGIHSLPSSEMSRSLELNDLENRGPNYNNQAGRGMPSPVTEKLQTLVENLKKTRESMSPKPENNICTKVTDNMNEGKYNSVSQPLLSQVDIPPPVVVCGTVYGSHGQDGLRELSLERPNNMGSSRIADRWSELPRDTRTDTTLPSQWNKMREDTPTAHKATDNFLSTKPAITRSLYYPSTSSQPQFHTDRISGQDSKTAPYTMASNVTDDGGNFRETSELRDWDLNDKDRTYFRGYKSSYDDTGYMSEHNQTRPPSFNESKFVQPTSMNYRTRMGLRQQIDPAFQTAEVVSSSRRTQGPQSTMQDRYETTDDPSLPSTGYRHVPSTSVKKWRATALAGLPSRLQQQTEKPADNSKDVYVYSNMLPLTTAAHRNEQINEPSNPVFQRPVIPVTTTPSKNSTPFSPTVTIPRTTDPDRYANTSKPTKPILKTRLNSPSQFAENASFFIPPTNAFQAHASEMYQNENGPTQLSETRTSFVPTASSLLSPTSVFERRSTTPGVFSGYSAKDLELEKLHSSTSLRHTRRVLPAGYPEEYISDIPPLTSTPVSTAFPPSVFREETLGPRSALQSDEEAFSKPSAQMVRSFNPFDPPTEAFPLGMQVPQKITVAPSEMSERHGLTDHSSTPQSVPHTKSLITYSEQHGSLAPVAVPQRASSQERHTTTVRPPPHSTVNDPSENVTNIPHLPTPGKHVRRFSPNTSSKRYHPSDVLTEISHASKPIKHARTITPPKLSNYRSPRSETHALTDAVRSPDMQTASDASQVFITKKVTHSTGTPAETTQTEKQKSASPEKQQTNAVYTVCEEDQPLVIDYNTQIRSPTAKQLENCVVTTTIKINGNENNNTIGRKLFVTDVSTNKILDETQTNEPFKGSPTIVTKTNVRNGPDAEPNANGANVNGNQSQPNIFRPEFQLGQSSPLNLSTKLRHIPDTITTMSSKNDANKTSQDDLHMGSRNSPVLSSKTEEYMTRKFREDELENVNSGLAGYIEQMANLVEEVKQVVNSFPVKEKDLDLWKELYARARNLENNLLNTDVGDNDGFGISSGVKRLAHTSIESLIHLIRSTYGNCSESCIAEITTVANQLLNAGEKLGATNHDIVLTDRLHSTSQHLAQLVEVLMRRSQKISFCRCTQPMPSESVKQSGIHQLNTYVGQVQTENPDLSLEDVFSELKAVNTFSSSAINNRKKNRASNTDLKYFVNVYPRKSRKMTIVSLVLGMVTGAILSCYWTNVTAFLGDVIVGFALYIWCSIRIIPQNPPV